MLFVGCFCLHHSINQLILKGTLHCSRCDVNLCVLRWLDMLNSIINILARFASIISMRSHIVSRLDSFIRRMQAQRIVLNYAAAALAARGLEFTGPVLELGLGNGRTYDHMREQMPGRRIIAFDRANVANPASCPPQEDFILGEIQDSGAAFAHRHGAAAVLVHADLGNGVAADDLVLAAWQGPLAQALVRPGGLVLTSTKLSQPGLQELPLPPDVPPGRYFMYRRS
jgi:S-adenosyl-L-methionine methyltransferase